MNKLENIFDDIKMYLPKYLSEDDTKRLLNELQSFPTNLDKRFYSSYLENENIIFQGDGLKDFIVVNLPDETFFKAPIIIFSNTCDIDNSNKRLFASNICYAPLFSLESYKEELLEEKIKDEQSINNHIEDIKKQKITQILYLPKGYNLPEDCIVFLDRLNHCDNASVPRENIAQRKIFILSNYGFYLFLVKISIHFTRIQEQVGRN
jgi:hypothetical protein